MVADQASGRPAGWKRDPSGRHYGRWWDGEGWTENVISAEKVQSVDPLQPRPPETISAPPPPPRPDPVQAARMSTPAGKSRRVPLWVKIAIPVVVVIGLASAGGDDSGKDVQVSGPAPTSEAATAPTATPAAGDRPVGATAKTGNLDVTVFGVTDPQPAPSRFEQPKAGFRFVAVDVQVANKSNRQERFSSILGFSLLDSSNRKYDAEFLSSLTPGPPEGEIPPGEAIRGFVVFQVPESATGLRFRVQGNLTAAGAFFKLG